MAAVTSHALGVTQAFAGDSRQFGGRTLEWPWYGFWAKSFHGAVDIETVIAGPQSEITKEQLTNDGKIKRKKKIPDFVLHYLRNQGIPRPMAHEGGPNLPKRSGEAVGTYTVGSTNGRLRPSYADIGGVVAIAIFGVCYSWRNVLRDAITDVSSNNDPSWKPSDQPSTDHDDGTNTVAAAALHAMSVAGPSDARPKRQPKPVERYQQYQKHKQLYFTSSEEDSSHPADRKAKQKDKAGTKINDAAKTKAMQGNVKKKGKKKGKAKSAEKPKPLQKAETTPAAHTPGAATLTAGAGSAAAESSSASGSASTSNEQQPKSEDGDEQRREGIEHVPDDEQDWSAWYPWDSIDGRRERVRMFNAVQR
ncbi:hypothetical protein DAEQUDRAFT_803192 [Daedalea quercina L-15889]|uniref:Uncharacterized protein n=1 Tax=Daedalea quercina L-15889 TaxID=1314783 RepID=A0A165LYG8_9APHY|nr:hypothetical protein DAEQUDRAFT_803192 [Daedalea quercina L-15889]